MPLEASHLFQGSGIEYYALARVGARCHLTLVVGNLFHHAVEMLIKGHLSKSQTLEQLKKLGHGLPQLWVAFKAEFPDPALVRFDSLVDSLQKFESIRYPDKMLESGAQITYAWAPPIPSVVSTSPPITSPVYAFSVTEIDELIAEIVRLSRLNPLSFTQSMNSHARQALSHDNSACKEWFP